MSKLWENNKVLVTGGAGFLGKNVVAELEKRGATGIVVPRSKKFNLTDFSDCKKVTKNVDIVIHLAANVGGIGYNLTYPATLYYENLLMGTFMLEAARQNNVKKFIAIGTICSYPKFTPVPFKESNLWNGYPEETNAPYGLAKKMLLVQSQAYRKQYGFNSIFLLPVNLYGPGDKFDPNQSHVIPALIKKFHDAKTKGLDEVSVWGTGRATREFLYVKDAAKAIILAAEKYNKEEPVNLGSSFEISIAELVKKISKIIGYKGKIVFDKSKPDGQPRRKLDTKRALKEFGFKSKTNFDRGLLETIDWYEREIKKHNPN